MGYLPESPKGLPLVFNALSNSAWKVELGFQGRKARIAPDRIQKRIDPDARQTLVARCECSLQLIDSLVGLEQIVAFHLNDSKTPLGSRVDRHAHIGKGEIGSKKKRFHPRIMSRMLITDRPVAGCKSGNGN